MNKYIIFLFGLSILIAGVIALLRYTKINSVYYPVIWCIWYACLNECLSLLLINNSTATYENNNIYTLVEAILITLFFKRMGLFRSKPLFRLMLCFYVLVWVGENLVLGNLHANSMFFRIIYSWAIVFMSITLLNNLIVAGTRHIFKNASFLLCTAFTIYFTFKILIEAFWIYGLNSSHTFLFNIYTILDYVNLFCNLIYAIAVLWMPKTQAFTLPL